jgi:predicted ribosome quality control (RQC) complex YloA/Tae2 family protein
MKEYEYECSITNKIYSIKVGETAQDNWDIIGDAENSDIWFHVDKFPSCHVILETDSTQLKKIHRSVLNYCASLCKEGSKQKNAKKVSIIYTEVKNVTINKKGDVGSVFTRKTNKLSA